MKKMLWVLILAAAALPFAAALAQDKPLEAGGDESNPDRKPGLDVFRVLIKPEAPPPPIIQPSVSAPPPAPPPPPPLQFSVKAIAGEAPHYVAVLNYNGNDYIAEEGWESDDHAFVVKRIGPDKSGQVIVEVFNKKTNRLAHKAYQEPKIPGYEGGAGGGGAADAGGGDAGGGGDLGLGGGSDTGGGSLDGGGPPPDAGGSLDGGGPPPDGGGSLDGGGPPPDAGGPPPDGSGGDGGGPPPQ